jgi:anaerobic C4-dicarboxylate transporter DcuA
MIWAEFVILLLALFIGVRFGSIGIGFAAGIGLAIYGILGVVAGSMDWKIATAWNGDDGTVTDTFFRVTMGDIPFDVIGIIMAVIAAIAAMQVAGGLDWLVAWADRLLRKNPKRITLVAPIITYFMTVLAGTGHTAFSTIPVIAEVAKENKIRPSRPLTISVVASQIAITASPVSAAVVAMSSVWEKKGVDYIQILAVAIPSTLLAIILTSFLANRLGKPLEQDPVYQERMAAGLVHMRGSYQYEEKKGAKASVMIFLVAIIAVVAYATAISDKVGLIKPGQLGDSSIVFLPRTEAIMIIMLAAAFIISWVGKIKVPEVLNAATFKSGMSACVCILGVAWLGTTFVNNNIGTITHVSSDVLKGTPWLLAVVCFLASALLYSQGATTKVMMPLASSLGVSPLVGVGSFAAVSGLFVLPTYPTTVAAMEMDDTGSTRPGKWVFNHPFFVPGVVAIALSCVFAFGLGAVIL